MVVATKPESLVIDALKQGRVTLKLIGRTPAIFQQHVRQGKTQFAAGRRQEIHR